MKIFEDWLNEEWSSEVTKALGKQFLTYTKSSKFFNDNDIDIAKSDYEVLTAPYSLKKFRKYPYVIVKKEDDKFPYIVTFGTNGDWDIHNSVGKFSSLDFDEVEAAVGITKVVKTTDLKNKRKSDYEDTLKAKQNDKLVVNRMKRMNKDL